MSNIMIAGIEFHTADLIPLFVLMGLVILGHLVALPLVIWGHVKLYRSKRLAHLVYVLPLSWYFIGLGWPSASGPAYSQSIGLFLPTGTTVAATTNVRGPNTNLTAPPANVAQEDRARKAPTNVLFAADRSAVPGVVIDHSPASSGIYIGSPSLAVLTNGDYVASHDEFGPKSTEHSRAVSHIFQSRDRGASWKKVSTIDGAFWSTLFRRQRGRHTGWRTVGCAARANQVSR